MRVHIRLGVGAAEDLRDNFVAIFSDSTAQWGNLYNFYNEIFLPYLVGGLGPGLVAALVGYWLSLPALHGYQKLRTARREARARRRAARQADAAEAADKDGSG